jgi:redox-sensing transcriptional repressor
MVPAGFKWKETLAPMSKPDVIPAPAVRRLSLYLRELENLLTQERRTVSSRQLGEALGITDAQVRKDLAYFGQFGHPGVGYRVEELVGRVRRILGTDKTWNVALVGAGNLGRALVCYRGYVKKGFEIVAVFDRDPKIIGDAVDPARNLIVEPIAKLRETVKKRNIRLGILCVPAESAQQVADQLGAAGVRGILNFAPIALRVQQPAAVASVDLAVHMEQLSFQVGNLARAADPGGDASRHAPQ